MIQCAFSMHLYRQLSAPALIEYGNPIVKSKPAVFAPQPSPVPPQPRSSDSQCDEDVGRAEQQTSEDKFLECCRELIDTDAVREWKFIGRHLSLKDHIIESINSAHGSHIDEAFYQMMTKWWRQEAEKATPEQLKKVLKKMHLNNVIPVVNKYSWL